MKRSMTFFLSLICATAMMAAPVAMAAAEKYYDYEK